jgi:hypothetical protein
MAPNPAGNSTQAADVSAGRRRLAAIVTAVALVWLIVLPAIGENPAMQAAIAEREARGIDSGAMFYTDLELMDDVLARSKQFHREHPDALWIPGSSR